MRPKRSYGRMSCLCRVTIARQPGGPPLEAQCVDINLGGARIASRWLVPVGQLITISFHIRTAAQNVVVERVFGKVVHAASDIDGHYLGVVFDEPLRPSR